MIIKEMTIINSRGDSIKFGHHFKLMDDFELSGQKAKVNYAESTMDGSRLQNTRLENQDYVIPFFIDRNNNNELWLEEKRHELYRVFNPKANPMRIDFTTKGGNAYYVNVNLESAPVFGREFESNNRLWLKGILQFSTGDPYFYEQKVQTVDVALWIGNFEFPLEIPEEGIEMGYRVNSYLANVVNKGQESTGMTIYFRTSGTVINPSLVNVDTMEEFKLDYTMEGGDLVEISTHRGNKSITLIRNNVRTSIFGSRMRMSKFLQLDVGDNVFRYDADSGVDRLDIQIKFTPRLIGV